jgi:hypothetical protein
VLRPHLASPHPLEPVWQRQVQRARQALRGAQHAWRAAETFDGAGKRIGPVSRNYPDLNELRETWRLAALEAARLDDAASRMEEGRSIRQTELILALVEKGTSITKATLMVKASEEWRRYVKAMYDCRRAANDGKIEAQNADRRYWSQVGSEADQRAEMRMTGR